MIARKALFATAIAAFALAGCRSEGDLVLEEGVGISALRTTCPAVGVPDYTGNITTFSAPGTTTQDAIDVTAAITNVRSTCDESGDQVYATATFDVQAQRRDARGARSVTLPFYSVVMRGGSAVVAKRVGTVTLNFADGEYRAQATGTGAAWIDRTAATLPDDIRQQITRRRRAGEEEAAVDPLTLPEVQAALARASFELLVGFQLTQDQLEYNARR